MLAKLKRRQQAIVSALPNDVELASSLIELGIVPSTKLTVLHKAPFKGPLLVQVQDAKLSINHRVAEQIVVELCQP